MLGGCARSSDDGSTGPTTIPTDVTAIDPTASTPPTTLAAEPLPRLVPIEATTLGNGFRRSRDERTFAEIDEAFTAQCPALARTRTRSEIAQRARFDFANRDPLPTVSHDVTVFADANAAASVFNALASNQMLRCLPKLVTSGGLQLGAVTTERVPVVDAGDATSALSLTGTSIAGGLASQVRVELIVVVAGPVLDVFVLTSSDLFPFSDPARDALVLATAR